MSETSKTEKFTVGVARCPGYGQWDIDRATEAAIANAGGLPRMIPASGGRILIKPNLLSPSYPDEAVTTHPNVVCALVKEIFRAGLADTAGMTDKTGSIRISDSPGYVFTDGKTLLERTGMASAGKACSADTGVLSDMGFSVPRKDGFYILKKPRISSRYMESDYCVNVAKLKTHVETEISCCIKNIFGTADADTRKKAHRSGSQKDLADAIIDIFSVNPPDFNLIDAVVGMEGNGPSHGSPRYVGWLIASKNALAADWVAAIIMGYENPAEIPLVSAAAERGLGPKSTGDIELVGACWEDLSVAGFKKSSGVLRLIPTPLRGAAHSLVKMRPRLNVSACTNCRICGEVCPVSAINHTGDYPEINKKTCVKCLCCNEMCPTGAMEVKKNLITRIVCHLKKT